MTLNDGRLIPQFGFGVWQISAKQVAPIVSSALEIGYRHIDTAPSDGNERGVGRAVQESGIARGELFVTTKLGNDRHGNARAALEESLERLGMEYVDLYLIQWPVPRVNRSVLAWHALEQAQTDGLVRSIGVSNFTVRYLDQILEEGGVPPAVNQIECHPSLQQRGVESANAERGIVTAAYSALGLGTDLRNETVASIAERTGRTPAQVVLRWHLQAGRVVIPEAVTSPHLAENFALADFDLPAEEIAAIDDLEAGKSNSQELWVDRFQVQRISRMASLSIAASPVLSAPSWSGPLIRTRTGVPGCSSA